MINPIKFIKARFAERERLAHLKYLEKLFKIEAKDGALWLTCDGVAVAKFENDTEAFSITTQLNNSRRCAKEFYSDPKNPYEP